MLNDCILKKATSFNNVHFTQNRVCLDIAFPSQENAFENANNVIIELQENGKNSKEQIECQLVVGSDGANSIVREKMFEKNSGQCEKKEIAHVYKTIIFEAKASEKLERDVVHTWPRGSSFIHCLPHKHGGFICTLVMKPLQASEERKFFTENYSEVLEICPGTTQRLFECHSLFLILIDNLQIFLSNILPGSLGLWPL